MGASCEHGWHESWCPPPLVPGRVRSLRARRLPRAVPGLLLLAGLASAPARGQSERLLEATRLQRASALELAQSELAACTRQGCAHAPQLSLLVGSLLLSRGEVKEALVQLRKHPAPAMLAPYRSFAIGQALFYTHDFRGAAAAFTEASSGQGVVAQPGRGAGRRGPPPGGRAGTGPPDAGAGPRRPRRPRAALGTGRGPAALGDTAGAQ